MEEFFQNRILFFEEGFLGSRWKAKLAVRGARQAPQIGLFKARSHEVLSIPHCKVHHPSINRARALLERSMEKMGVEPYRETPSGGAIRYAQFFVERDTGKVQLTLVLNQKEKTPWVSAFLQELLKEEIWHSIWVNYHPTATNSVFGSDWELLWGDTWLWQRLHTVFVAFHPGSFAQAHLPLFERMVKSVEEWVPQGSSCLELYAGAGAMALNLAEKCQKLDLVENNPWSALSFRESLKRLPVALQNRFSYRLANASESDLTPYDVLLVDPPRKGLDAPLLASLCQSENQQRLIYVSCSFQSFKRDAEVLVKNGWNLVKGEGYFLFPGTNEIEVLALFGSNSFKDLISS